jgi:hypothetical protein
MHGTEMFKAFLNRWHATTAVTCPPVFEASLLRKVKGGKEKERKIRQFTTITIATKYTYSFSNISLCYLYLITRIVLPIYYYL